MDFIEQEPLTPGWNRRTALLGTERLAVPIRIYAQPFVVNGKTEWAKAYMLDRLAEWISPDDLLAHMLALKSSVEAQGIMMAKARMKVNK